MSVCHVKMSCVFSVPNSKGEERYKFYRYLGVFARFYCQKVESKYIWHIWHKFCNNIGITETETKPTKTESRKVNTTENTTLKN